MTDRIAAIEDVSDALFEEWQTESSTSTPVTLYVVRVSKKLRETKSSCQTCCQQ
ncbi:DUF2959 domain-containing protein [Vibrio chagasii]|nr:DUF2959 domain-containing protein [Vibrio chagasii]